MMVSGNCMHLGCTIFLCLCFCVCPFKGFGLVLETRQLVDVNRVLEGAYISYNESFGTKQESKFILKNSLYPCFLLDALDRCLVTPLRSLFRYGSKMTILD